MIVYQARAEMVSAENCVAVIGVQPATMRKLLREYRRAGGDVVRLGREPAAPTDAFVAWLMRREQPALRKPPVKTATPKSEPANDSVPKDIAGALGFRKAGAR